MTTLLSFFLLAGLFFRHGNLVKDILTAAGGALIGGLFTAFILVLLFKAVYVKKIPRRTTIVLSVLGGLIAGWIVWNWTSSGGFGPGPGGGVVGGPGTGKDGIPISTSNETGAASTRREPTDTLRVVIVRSADYEKDSQRYYLIDGKTPARNLDEAVQSIQDRKKLNPALNTLEVIVYLDSITEARKLADALQEPAEKEGLTWKLSKPDMRAP
jgi:hypothetical protein